MSAFDVVREGLHVAERRAVTITEGEASIAARTSLDSIEAENERLRGALWDIANIDAYAHPDETCFEIARTALARIPESKESWEA